MRFHLSPFPRDPAELQVKAAKVICTVVSPQLMSSLHQLDIDDQYENGKLSGVVFSEVLSTSRAIQLVEIASAKLLKPCLVQDCDAIVTNRVDVKHLRPSVTGTRLVTVVTYVATRDSFDRVEGVISDSAGLCIAMVDAWFSLVCKINVESDAILSLENLVDVRNALMQVKAAWNTSLANRHSDLMGGNGDLQVRHQIACERSKVGRYDFLSGFEHCIQHGSDGLAMLWLTKGRAVLETEDLSSGLQLAAKHRGLSVVKLLLDNGADVNYRAKSLIKTALHEAVHRECLEIVQLLLDRGASPSLRYSSNDDSPLHTAAAMCNTDLCAALLKAGADINDSNEHGWTPLMLAIRSGKNTLRLLVESGANVNQTDDEGWTSLHFAVDYGGPGLLKYLLKHGADSTVQNTRGDTPLRLAARLGRFDIARELLKCGVDPSLGPGCCTALEWVQGEKLPTCLAEPARLLRP
ncbi:ankyrin-2 [Aspergillus pseudoviridinutans]|uniref:Ankyrin-2 n=1 Tax=Aspergillus pseudoviridinutans TaxID=1517512 RepID=A0A9P3BHF3_9EURO|nr:ankyrin-2 [Aspergillus pseudoviridinutans]GIJ91227.1 ankyrin-2 [Aspergillus pseudoviridinutans]